MHICPNVIRIITILAVRAVGLFGVGVLIGFLGYTTSFS
jgi:hypothetical protein